MEEIDYKNLYSLQDSIFSIMAKADTNFYLTGGTCLHRFYYQQRYSDDLDFFTNENNLFREDCRILLDEFAKADLAYETIVDSRDFVRIIVERKYKCKIDFVNDRVYRYGRNRLTEEGIVIDNIENILSNKLCAVLGRDEPKDVFDICAITIRGNVEWNEIVKVVNTKCVLDLEVLEFRLKSFPLNLLETIPVIDSGFLLQLRTNYKDIIALLFENLTA